MTTIPSITALPTPPQTSDPTNFDTRADAFLAALDSPFVTEVNAFATAANTVAGEVSTNATNAAASAATATTEAGTATTEAGTATTQAGIATTQASNASTSAAAALVSQNAAAASAGALSANANSYRTVDYVATSNVAIATALANGQTLDGGTLATGQRVLLTAQSTASQNGIYDVPASGAASRSADSNSATLMPSGIEVRATRGTNYKGVPFVHTTAPGFTLGSTSLTFAASPGFANRNYTASTNLSPTGTSSASLKQMGLAVALTPKYTGRVRITAYGYVTNITASNSLLALANGTGSAPANGATATGTIAPGVFASIVAGYKVPWSFDHEISGLSIGTAYWFDIALDVDGGTASMVVGQIRVEEIGA